MLTRYEELFKPERDEHGRFPAVASLAFQNGFLDRPIIDEYIEILWFCMQYLWPGLERKQNIFKVELTHDVDSPYQYAFTSPVRIIKNCVGDLIKRKSPAMALDRYINWRKVTGGNLDLDPNNLFKIMMDISERYKLSSTFFFKASCGKGELDYSLGHPYIIKLLKEIACRGHRIGLHPGYGTVYSADKIKSEFELLKKICEQRNIKQDEWGGRQHYLLWEAPVTWQCYEDAGLDYDTSLTYADHVGFRCGTCHEFPVFNLQTGQQLNLVEKPLIVMESSLLADKYMSLSHDKAFQKLKKLIDSCKINNGNFVMLWHNSSLLKSDDMELYLKTLEYCYGS